jgi:hypothetical protein
LKPTNRSEKQGEDEKRDANANGFKQKSGSEYIDYLDVAMVHQR